MTVLRSLRRRFGIAAPRVAVRTHVPWYVMALAAVLALASLWLLSWGLLRPLYDPGAASAPRAATELARLQERIRLLEAENGRLREAVAGGERQLQIEAATHVSVGQQAKALAVENAGLREDLAFFQSMASHPVDGGLGINRFELEPGVQEGEHQFRLLVVQPRAKGRDFKGRLQLEVEVEQDGKRTTMPVPSQGENPGQLTLNFRFFQRVEGVFRTPAGATVKRVEVLVMEQGNPTARSTRTFHF